MPKVGKKEMPYTKKGMEDAMKEHKRTGMPMVVTKGKTAKKK